MTGTLTDLSAEYLIARGIAPVKREYWKPITARQEVAAVGSALAQRSSAPAERKTKKKARQVRLQPASDRRSTRVGLNASGLTLCALVERCCTAAGTGGTNQHLQQFLGRSLRV